VLVIALWAVLATVTAATAFGGIRYRSAAEITIIVFAAITIDSILSLILSRFARKPGVRRSSSTDDQRSAGVIG